MGYRWVLCGAVLCRFASAEPPQELCRPCFAVKMQIYDKLVCFGADDTHTQSVNKTLHIGCTASTDRRQGALAPPTGDRDCC